MTAIELQILDPGGAQDAASIMHDALSIPARLWQLINDPINTTYAAYQATELVGAAILRWSDNSEIEVLSVDRGKRGQGIGKDIISALIEEARNKNAASLLVGTSSMSLENIMFYQKCGFRMSHVRRDYFVNTYPEQTWEWRGVPLRDMIVFEYRLEK